MTIKSLSTDRRAPAAAGAGGLIAGPPGVGQKGDPPSLIIGSVTTLAPDASATAAIVAIGLGAYRVDLGLPKGDQGIPGSLAGTIVTSQITDAGEAGVHLVQCANLAAVKTYLELTAEDIVGALDTSLLGAPSGIATLNAGGKLPMSQLADGAAAASLGFTPARAGANSDITSLDLQNATLKSQIHVTSGSGAGASTGGWITGDNSNGLYFSGGHCSESGAWTAKATVSSMVACASGVIAFYSNSGLTPGAAFTPTERMRVDLSGNLGIGTTAPDSRLHVVGNVHATGTIQSDAAGGFLALGGGYSIQGPGGFGSYNPSNPSGERRSFIQQNSSGQIVMGFTNDAGTVVNAAIYFNRDGTSSLPGGGVSTFAALTDKTSYFPGATTNVQFTGIPGLDMSNGSGWMIYNNQASATGLNANLRVQRDASYTGGTTADGATHPALWILDNINVGVIGHQWSLIIETNTYATDTGSQNVGLNVTTRAYPTGGTHAGPTWATNFVIEDRSASNPTSGRVGIELDAYANGTDEYNNRVALDIVCGKVGGVGVAPEIANGIRIGPQVGDNTNGRFKTGIVLKGNMDQGIDMRGMQAENGGSPIIFDMALSLRNWTTDAAAAADGVPIGGMYRNGSQLMARVS